MYQYRVYKARAIEQWHHYCPTTNTGKGEVEDGTIKKQWVLICIAKTK